jgi:hypothetical protein
MKKVLFYSPITYTPHWEIELNMMENYLRSDWQVVLLKCDAELPACMANPYHTFTRCLECKTRKKAGIKWIGKDRIKVKNVTNLTELNKKEIDRLKNLKIKSTEHLKQIELEGSDIGMAALSSAITTLRESEIDVEKHAELLTNYLVTAAITHFSAINHFTEESPDEVVIFNGRPASVRPALRAAWKLGIETVAHESGKVSNRFWTVKNEFLHSLSGGKAMIEETFKTSVLPRAEMKKIAAEWFEDRRDKSSKNQIIFIGGQEENHLPENFSDEKTNIVIFNSSEDEFVGFDEYKNPYYESQNQGIMQMVENFKNDENIHFYIRIHPNLKDLENVQIKFLYQMAENYTNLTLIEPESPVDSYYLLEVCDLIVIFNSTMGMEAVYAGKTPILMGKCLYEDLGGIIKPKSHEEFVKLVKNFLENKTLPKVNGGEEAWIKYGYFMKQGGQIPDFIEKDDWWNARMKRDGRETYIKPSIASKVLNVISNRLNRAK